MNKLLIILFLSTHIVCAQKNSNDIVVPAQIVNGDTLPVYNATPVTVWGERTFLSPKDKQNFDRLVRHVKKVYPYAKIAEQRYREYAKLLATIDNEKDKRRLMKQAEEDIKAEFYNDIRQMTYTQGKILLKLIYRQTNYTSYELLQDYRGELRTVFWQGVARIFGANLKATYDPYGEDKHIEEIIIMIDNGLL